LAPKVGPLSSLVLDCQMSGSLAALCCLAWLAQCGGATDDLDPRAVHALCVADRPFGVKAIHDDYVDNSSGYDFPAEAELPTRGLINLLAELLIVRGQRDVGSITSDATLPLSLLLLVVHRLPAPSKEDEDEEEEENKVTEVLLALGETIDYRELAQHEHQWWAHEAALRRHLAESSLLNALLQPW
jgi:hypothetical protein